MSRRFAFRMGGVRAWLLAAFVGVSIANEGRAVPTAPGQPTSGPGGSSYVHAEVVRYGPFWAEGRTSDDSRLYYIYQPASPAPVSAPVVLFLHGWLGNQPVSYESWIEHIVKKGYTVVWARFDDGLDPFQALPDSALVSWRDALARLVSDNAYVPPTRDGDGKIMTAHVGHSIGGYLSAILAARAADERNGIPQPAAVAAFLPGAFGYVPYEDLGAIDPNTRMLVVVGDEDSNVCTLTGREIWNNTSQIPDENRDFLLVKSDRYGRPEQLANHFFPANGGFLDTAAVDARDFFITYKLSVALIDCALWGENCAVALGNGAPSQISLGQWSDGRPVQPMVWIADPEATLQPQCDEQAPGPNGRRPLPPEPGTPPRPIVEFEEMTPRGLSGFENSGVWSMKWWKGKLYVGTVQSWYCFSQAWFHIQFPDLWNWPPVAPHQCTEDIRELPLRAEIWRYTPETDFWERVYQSPAVPIPGEPGHFTGRDIGYRSVAVVREPDGTEALYFGGVTANLLWQPMPPPRLLRTVDGATFEPVPQEPGTFLGDLGTGEASFRAMTTYNDRLYVLNSDIQGKGPILEASNPAGGNDNFRRITPDGMSVFDMAAFNGWLYLGVVGEREGYSIVKTQARGTPPYDFLEVVPPGAGKWFRPSKAVTSMHVFGGRLYVGTDRPCEIIRINPDDTWDLVVGQPRWTPQGFKRPISGIGTGFGYELNYHIWRMQAHEGVLYVGTFDESAKWVIILQALERIPEGRRFYETLVDRAGFDLYATADGQHFTKITTDGFGNFFDRGIRNFASTPLGLFVGGVNEVEGLMVWRGQPSTASRAASAPPPPQCLQVERAYGFPLLSWEPSPDADVYQIYRSDQGSDYSFELVGATRTTYFTDGSAGWTGFHDYFVVAENASGDLSQPSNMAAFPSANPPVTVLSLTLALREWRASSEVRADLAGVRLSLKRRKYSAALSQLDTLSARVLQDPALAPWRAQDAAMLVRLLKQRVILADMGVLLPGEVLRGP